MKKKYRPSVFESFDDLNELIIFLFIILENLFYFLEICERITHSPTVLDYSQATKMSEHKQATHDPFCINI